MAFVFELQLYARHMFLMVNVWRRCNDQCGNKAVVDDVCSWRRNNFTVSSGMWHGTCPLNWKRTHNFTIIIVFFLSFPIFFFALFFSPFYVTGVHFIWGRSKTNAIWFNSESRLRSATATKHSPPFASCCRLGFHLLVVQSFKVSPVLVSWFRVEI